MNIIADISILLIFKIQDGRQGTEWRSLLEAVSETRIAQKRFDSYLLIWSQTMNVSDHSLYLYQSGVINGKTCSPSFPSVHAQFFVD